MMRSVFTFACILVCLLGFETSAQISKTLPIQSAGEPFAGVGSPIAVDFSDRTKYDRWPGKFSVGINWGTLGDRPTNEIFHQTIYDGGGGIESNCSGSEENNELMTVPKGSRIIARTPAPAGGVELFDHHTCGMATRLDPELNYDDATSYGILREGDLTGAIRTFAGRDANVVQRDSVIRLRAADFDASPEETTTTLYANGNHSVLRRQTQKFKLPTVATDVDQPVPYSGSDLYLTIQLRRLGAGSSDYSDDTPVLRLRVYSDLQEYNRGSREWTKELDPQIVYFRELPKNKPSLLTPSLSAFPVATSHPRTGLIRGHCWAHTAVRPDQSKPENSGKDEPGNNKYFCREMIITKGMLNSLGDLGIGDVDEDGITHNDAGEVASPWVSFSGLIKFYDKIHFGRKEKFSNHCLMPRGGTGYLDVDADYLTKAPDGGEYSVAGKLSIEVEFEGGESSSDVDIDFITLETPNAQKLLRDELRYEIVKAIKDFEPKLTPREWYNTDPCVSKPRYSAGDLRIKAFRTFEEDGEQQWLAQRYLATLMHGYSLTEQWYHPFKYWQHVVDVPEARPSDAVNGSLPLWRWEGDIGFTPSTLTTPPYIRQAINYIKDDDDHAALSRSLKATFGFQAGVEGTYLGRTHKPWPGVSTTSDWTFSEYVHSLSLYEISRGLAMNNDDDNDVLNWKDTDYTSNINGPKHENKILENLATGALTQANFIAHCITQTYKADQHDWTVSADHDSPILLGLERYMYNSVYDPVNGQRFFDGTPWLYQLWMDQWAHVVRSESGVGDVPDGFYYDGLWGRRQQTAEEIRYRLGMGILLGGKGVMVYLGHASYDQHTDQPGNLWVGLMNEHTQVDGPGCGATVGCLELKYETGFSSYAFPSASDQLKNALGIDAGRVFGTDYPILVDDTEIELLPNAGAYMPYFLRTSLGATWGQTKKYPALFDNSRLTTNIAITGASVDNQDILGLKDHLDRYYLGLRSPRREVVLFSQALAKPIPEEYTTNASSTTWQDRLWELHLASWYGKGYLKLHNYDDSRYTEGDPLAAMINLDAIQVRHPYRYTLLDPHDGGDPGAAEHNAKKIKDYESADSTFYDITLLRRARETHSPAISYEEIPLETEWYLGVANRRTNPIVLTDEDDTDDDGYPYGNWRFVTPDDMDHDGIMAAAPYKQLGSREITLPFHYRQDGKARMFRLTEMNVGLTTPQDDVVISGSTTSTVQAEVKPGIDVLISSTGTFAVNLLPGETKLFRVVVMPIATEEAKGHLAFNTQSKIVVEHLREDTSPYELTPNKVRYHMVYHRKSPPPPEPPALPIPGYDGKWRVYYKRSMPVTVDIGDVSTLDPGDIQWQTSSVIAGVPMYTDVGMEVNLCEQIELQRYIVGTNIGTMDFMTAPLNLSAGQKALLETDFEEGHRPRFWSCAFPSITLHDNGPGVAPTVHVVYALVHDSKPSIPPIYRSTLQIIENQFPANADFPVVGNPPVNMLPGRSQAFVSGAPDYVSFGIEKMLEYGTPVIASTADPNYIAWRGEDNPVPIPPAAPIGQIVAIGKRPSTLLYPYRTDMYAGQFLNLGSRNHAKFPTVNPMSNFMAGHEDCSLAWQQEGEIHYTRLFAGPLGIGGVPPALIHFVPPVSSLCYYQVTPGTCALPPTIAVTPYDADVLRLSSLITGTKASMPSITRGMPLWDDELAGEPEITFPSSPTTFYNFTTEAITYQVWNQYSTGRSSISRKFFIETRPSASARYPAPSGLKANLSMKYWTANSTYDDDTSLFHSHIVQGKHIPADFSAIYSALYTSGVITSHNHLMFQSANISDTSLWNTYSAMPYETYLDYVDPGSGEELTTFAHDADQHTSTATDLIPLHEIMFQKTGTPYTSPSIHAMSVTGEGAWPHISTQSYTLGQWAFNRNRHILETEPASGTDIPGIEVSAERFYKGNDSRLKYRRYFGMETDSGEIAVHPVIDGQELGMSWQAATRTTGKGEATSTTLELVSEPFLVKSVGTLEALVKGTLSDQADFFIDELSDDGVEDKSVGMGEAFSRENIATGKLDFTLVNGSSNRYRLRMRTREMESVPLEITQRNPADESFVKSGHQTRFVVDLAATKMLSNTNNVLTISPNPASGICVIILPRCATEKKLTLIVASLQGEVFVSRSVPNGGLETVDVNEWSAGTYLVRVVDASGVSHSSSVMTVLR